MEKPKSSTGEKKDEKSKGAEGITVISLSEDEYERERERDYARRYNKDDPKKKN